MTTDELDQALAGIHKALNRVCGHLAITQQREREIEHRGYQKGYAAGLKVGKDQGFREGWEEAKVFETAT